jgi:hypothetical protein
MACQLIERSVLSDPWEIAEYDGIKANVVLISKDISEQFRLPETQPAALEPRVRKMRDGLELYGRRNDGMTARQE